MRNNSFWLGMFLGGIVGATAFLTKKMLINSYEGTKVNEDYADSKQKKDGQFTDTGDKAKNGETDNIYMSGDNSREEVDFNKKVNFDKKVLELEKTLNNLKEKARE